MNDARLWMLFFLLSALFSLAKSAKSKKKIWLVLAKWSLLFLVLLIIFGK